MPPSAARCSTKPCGDSSKATQRWRRDRGGARPAAVTEVLAAIVDELIAAADIGVAQAAFWRQEMRRIAEWFSLKDAELRFDVRTIYPEVKGAIELQLGDGSPFRISARADRIDERTDGTLRLSPGPFTTVEDIDTFLAALTEITAGVL